MYQDNPVGIELFSYVKTFFCSNELAWLLATWVKTLYWLKEKRDETLKQLPEQHQVRFQRRKKKG